MKFFIFTLYKNGFIFTSSEAFAPQSFECSIENPSCFAFVVLEIVDLAQYCFDQFKVKNPGVCLRFPLCTQSNKRCFNKESNEFPRFRFQIFRQATCAVKTEYEIANGVRYSNRESMSFWIVTEFVVDNGSQTFNIPVLNLLSVVTEALLF